jgi:hypothetical protein
MFIEKAYAYTFINWSEGNTTTMIGYITNLIGDLMPVILVILGITIAVYFIRAFLHRGD